MAAAPEFGGFSDVDATGAAGGYAAYLDGARAIDAVAVWKERSFALLEPRPGAVLVDVGCGTGDDVLALAGRVAPGGRVIGIDASAAMIDEARRRAGGRPGAAEFRVADARDTGLADASVDGCRAERTLQHLDRPGEAVCEMARVVRPGGRVVVAEPDWGTLVVDPGDPGVGRAVAAAAAGRVRSPSAGRALRRLLVEAGLTDVGVAARTLVLTDRRHAEALLDLEGAVRAAVADGDLDRARAGDWRAELARAGSDGRFLAAMTAFMAWGTRRSG